MSTLGIATEAPLPAEATEHQQRHLRSVKEIASLVVATEYALPEVAISSEDQILFGD